MKLSKRILAVMLACVMALCMLTACGGGSGSGGSSGGGSGTVTTNDDLTSAVNSALEAAGLNTITHDASLDEKAQKYAAVYTGDNKVDYAAAGIDYDFIKGKGTEFTGMLGYAGGLQTDWIVSDIVSTIEGNSAKNITAYGYYRTSTSIYYVFKYGTNK